MAKKEKISLFYLVIFILLISQLSGCFQKREMINVNGEKRTYLLHVPPSYSNDNPVPLVIVFHGGGGNAENIEFVTGFSEKADEEGFIVVYPDGSGKLPRKLLTWNGGFCCGYALDHNIDDVYFIKILIQKLREDYNINLSRIYAAGISNGGVMTYRIGSELSDIFAAISPVSAQIGGETTEEDIWRIPEPHSSVSVIAFNGMKDTHVPYYGGIPIENTSHVYWWMGVNDSISFWVRYNNCSNFPKRTIYESGNIIIDWYDGGKNNTDVVLTTIVDGKHAWPGGKKGWNNGDDPSLEINATDMIWEFFTAHPKK